MGKVWCALWFKFAQQRYDTKLGIKCDSNEVMRKEKTISVMAEYEFIFNIFFARQIEDKIVFKHV